jgi:hypothetical protein
VLPALRAFFSGCHPEQAIDMQKMQLHEVASASQIPSVDCCIDWVGSALAKYVGSCKDYRYSEHTYRRTAQRGTHQRNLGGCDLLDSDGTSFLVRGEKAECGTLNMFHVEQLSTECRVPSTNF